MKTLCDFCQKDAAEVYWGEDGPDSKEGSMLCSKCSESNGLTFLLQGLKCVSISPSVTAEQMRAVQAQEYAKNSFLARCMDKMPHSDADKRTFDFENYTVVVNVIEVFNSLKSRPKVIFYIRSFDIYEGQYDSIDIMVVDLLTWSADMLFNCPPGTILKELLNFIQGDALYYMDQEVS